MRITNPQNIFFFLFLIPVCIGFIIYFFKGISDLQKISGSWRFSLIKRIYRVRYILSSVLFFLALVSMLIGILGASWQMKPEKDDSYGLEIIFALDISRSMLAKDLQPNRLEKSTSYISSVVENLPGVKFGIVTFKGDAIVSVPVTEDTVAIQRILSSISPELIATPGSNQEKAVDLALDSFSKGSQNRSLIILISDGEALEGDLFKIVNKSLNLEIPIYSVSVGSSAGGTIPIGNNNNEVVSSGGKPVVSKVNKQLLMDISELTYGRFYSLVEGSSIGETIRDIKALGYDQIGEKLKYVNVIEFRLFLLISLLFLLLYVFFKEWRWSEIL